MGETPREGVCRWQLIRYKEKERTKMSLGDAKKRAPMEAPGEGGGAGLEYVMG